MASNAQVWKARKAWPDSPSIGVVWGWAGVSQYFGRSIDWCKRAHQFRPLPLSLINGKICTPKLALDRWVLQGKPARGTQTPIRVVPPLPPKSDHPMHSEHIY